jgi:hypothetical protein
VSIKTLQYTDPAAVSYCIDCTIPIRIMQLKLAQANAAKVACLVRLVLTTLFLILIGIANVNFIRIRPYIFAVIWMIKHKMLDPLINFVRRKRDSQLDKCIRYHQQWQHESRHLRIDYDRCLGSGEWSKVFFGMHILKILSHTMRSSMFVLKYRLVKV